MHISITLHKRFPVLSVLERADVLSRDYFDLEYVGQNAAHKGRIEQIPDNEKIHDGKLEISELKLCYEVRKKIVMHVIRP